MLSVIDARRCSREAVHLPRFERLRRARRAPGREIFCARCLRLLALGNVVYQKYAEVEGCDDVVVWIRQAVNPFGAECVVLHSYCGFATFADNPICAAVPAEITLARIAEAVARVCGS